MCQSADDPISIPVSNNKTIVIASIVQADPSRRYWLVASFFSPFLFSLSLLEIQFPQKNYDAMAFKLFHHHLIRSDERVSHLLSQSHIEGVVDGNFICPSYRVRFAQ